MPQASFLARGATYVDPRMGLSVPGRFLVRVLSNTTLVLLLACAVLGLLSDVPTLRGVGLLALLMFGERMVYRTKADHPLSSLTGTTPNLAVSFTPAAYTAMERAYDAMRVTRQPFGMALLAQLLRDRSVVRALERTEADLDALGASEVPPLEGPLSDETVTALFAGIAAAAADASLALRLDEVTPLTLLSGLLASGDQQVSRAALRAKLDLDDLTYAAAAAVLDARRVQRTPRVVPHHTVNRAWTSRPTPMLDKVASDLTDLARLALVPPLIGHRDAYQTVLTGLAKVVHPHVLLVAPAAGGKETIAGEVARAMVSGTAPAPLADRRLVRLDVSALLAAGGSDPAQTVKLVADEIVAAGNVVLYVPNFEHLAQATGAYVAAADVLLPILSADTFPVLAATTPEAYARILETRGDVAGSFEVVRLDPLSVPDTIAVLSANARSIESANRVRISVTALRTAAILAARYLAPTRPVPGGALDLLAESAQAVHAAGGKHVTAADVERTIERELHVPIGEAKPPEAKVLLGLETTLQERVLGQDEAVTAVAESVRAYRAGLVVNDMPPSFLFVGPTGVGKTELAKALSDAVYGANAFTRLDMSEFSESNSVARLIGTSTEAGALTEPVRQSPHRLLLLDELEKASHEAVRLLLQVIGDGRLTDGAGRTVSFTDTLIVATSNAKSELLREALTRGEGVASLEGYLRQKLVDVFPTELLNRFTRIVVFKDLSTDHLRTIARMTIAEIGKLLESRYGVTLDADDAALGEIVKRGYDPQWGARPMRRAAETALDSVLAPKLIAGEVQRGTSVTLTYTGTAFSLR